MPRKIFFRNEWASVTSTELVVGNSTFPMTRILSGRGFRRRYWGFLSRYVLVIKTLEGEQEVLRHRNGYVVFQLAHAVEAALRAANEKPNTGPPAPNAREVPKAKPQMSTHPFPSLSSGV